MSAFARLPEAERNSLLRRVDWRFLLEHENEPRALAPEQGELARALALVSEWAPLHGNELLMNWKRARLDKPLQPIEPLP